MRRSEINRAIRDMLDLLERQRFSLPPFAHAEPDSWASRGAAFDEIREAGLGWDVTDFGSGNFAKVGLTLFTLRNGRPGAAGGKTYCEKVMMVREGQVTPMHFHWKKTEDIINRGGGNLVCELHSSGPDELLSTQPVTVSIDGERRELPAGTKVVLQPGQSITFTPYLYHAFWGEPGRSAVLLGEVSSVNDDTGDNRFLEPLPRYPGVEEDQPPFRLLCTEYPQPGINRPGR